MFSREAELRSKVQAILADPRFDDLSFEQGRDEAIWDLAGGDGWETVRDEMIALLEDDAAQRHWVVACVVLWRGVDRPMPAMKVIALLNYRLLADLPSEQALDENLVWSITHNLRGVEYLSDYDPVKDPEVRAELARLRR